MAKPRTLEEFVNWLDWRRRNDYDNVIVITGEEGYGKSNLALAIAVALDGDDFDPSRVIFNTEEWHQGLTANLHRRGLTWMLDEGGNLGLSWEWSSGEGRALVKILQQARILNSTMLWAIPNFRWLNVYMRDHRVIARLTMLKRGVARISYRERSPTTEEVWFEPGPIITAPNIKTENPCLWRTYQSRKEASVPTQITKLTGDVANRREAKSKAGVQAEIARLEGKKRIS